MQPIEEYGKGRSRPYGKRLKMRRKHYTDNNSIFYGSGFVQLTWYEHYEKAEKKIKPGFYSPSRKSDESVERHQDHVFRYADVCFTGRKLSMNFNAKKEHWKNARRIINGLDRADWIADHARKYYAPINYTI